MRWRVRSAASTPAQGAVQLYGIGSDVYTAGKTGTAQRAEGQEPHSWFIGFAPAQAGATRRSRWRSSSKVAARVPGARRRSGGRVMAEWLKLAGG